MKIIKFTAFFLIIIFSLSINAQQKLENGTKVHNFSVKDNYNKKIDLYQILNKQPVVLIFYRGEWCKHCNLYMNDLSDSLSMITDLGAKIIAITPESSYYIDETIKKTNANFSIVYDEGHKIMDNYKVTWHVSGFAHFFYKLRGINLKKSSKNSDNALPVPATYIIGTDKKIINGYFNKDYTRRMPVREIVKTLKSIQ